MLLAVLHPGADVMHLQLIPYKKFMPIFTNKIQSQYIACASVSFSYLYNPIGTRSHIIVMCDTPVLQYTAYFYEKSNVQLIVGVADKFP